MADTTVDFFADPDPQPGFPGLETAVADPSAAENDEGVPTFSDALDADATPDGYETEGTDTEGDDQPDETDWKAKAQELEGHLTQQQQLEVARQQQAMYQEALQAFENEAQQHERYAAENLGTEEAIQYLSQYRKGREQRMREYFEGAINSIIQNVTTVSYADHIIQHYGLDPEDKVLLGTDPKQMEAQAQRLQAREQRIEQRFSKTDRDIKNLKRGQQARRLVQSGATRSGGGGQRIPSVDPKTLTPAQQLAGLLSGRIQDGY